MGLLKKLVIKILYSITLSIVSVKCFLSKFGRMAVGMVLEEFHHEDLRGFGGYAMTAKNISDYYNTRPELSLQINILLASQLAIAQDPRVEKFHNAKVLFRPFDDESPNIDLIRYLWCFGMNPSRILLTFEYYVTYDYVLRALYWLPVIIYFRDPRGPEEWERLVSVPMELQWRNINSAASFYKAMERENNYIHKMIDFSKKHKRKVIFASNAEFLSQRAKKAYNLPDIKPYFLPNPLIMPKLDRVITSPKPSIIFIGRLDPQKRIWMVFELAKRFKDIDFIIGGSPSTSGLIEPKIMLPVIEKYKHLSNLKMVGTIDGEAKWKTLRESWGLINTSIHEGMPVTFFESLCVCKPIISCLNPDDITSRFGYYTGDILGEGMDEESLGKFSKQIELFLSNPKEREEKGRLGREYVEKRHSFENFDKHLRIILEKENI